MLSVQQISLEFPTRVIFDQISFLINTGDKVSLVGRNGAGKSTLLKILAGQQPPQSGSVNRPKEFSLGYLPQELKLPQGKSVREETETAFAELRAIEARMEVINEQLATRTDYESQAYIDLIQELTDKTQLYELKGGYNAAGEVEKVLFGLGFQPEELDRSLDTFSGGWRMRVELAKILLLNHDVILLDEPTNHLDIESIIWLEDFLKSHPAAIVLVSHDRNFMDNVTNRTIEIVNGKIYDYPAPYSRFLILREERVQQQINAKKNQEKEIKETQQLIDRFRAKASKASFAQSLIKKLDRMETIGVDEMESGKINFSFPHAEPSGKVVLKVENVKKSYGEKQVLRGVDLEIERGDRVSFLGQNGQGKTTLVKLLMNEIQGEGEIQWGHNVKIGYYAQEQTSWLDGEKTVLQTIEDEAPDDIRPRVRSMLGAFMFSGEEVTKKVKVLSGGEKGRLALCKLLLKPVNVLVMDEPTNHLDLRSKDVLKQALRNFQGTVILVSHDRDFLHDLTDKSFEFKSGKVKTYLGDIKYFLEAKKMESFREYEQQKEAKVAKEKVVKASQVNQKEIRAQEKEAKKRKRQLEKAEEEIARLELEIAEMDAKLQNPETYKTLIGDEAFFESYNTAKSKLEALMEKWAVLSET
ncbi:MAG: ABC-F family ATP-binding cassette domain-containing protein [Cryomorphaceae bacterium]|nr:ABC-F family ATP-binding cassette domain-containing protein [Cryomorphaceae bacterium]